MLFGWEGNCRFGVSPAMHHRLCGIIVYGLNDLLKERSLHFSNEVALFTLCYWLVVIRMQEKDTKNREQKETERLRKIRDIREAEKQASLKDRTSNNTHWVRCLL